MFIRITNNELMVQKSCDRKWLPVFSLMAGASVAAPVAPENNLSRHVSLSR